MVLGNTGCLHSQPIVNTTLGGADSLAIVQSAFEVALRYEVLLTSQEYKKDFVPDVVYDNQDYSKLFVNIDSVDIKCNLVFFGYRDVEFFSWEDDLYKDKSFRYLQINYIKSLGDGSLKVLLTSNLFIKGDKKYIDAFVVLEFERGVNGKWYYRIMTSRE